MSWNLAGDRRRRPRLLTAAALLAAAAVVAAAAVGLHGAVTARTSRAPAASRAVPTPDPTGRAGPPPARPAPPGGIEPRGTGLLRLPAPARTGGADGVDTGYPHTPEGAVSAAVHYASQTTSLDPDRAARATTAVADPAWHDAGQQSAQLSRSVRQRLSLPPSGPVTDAYLSVHPLRYQLSTAGPDRADVDLLTDVSFGSPATGPVSAQQVVHVPLSWVGGDWRLTARKPSSAPPAADDTDWRGFDE